MDNSVCPKCGGTQVLTNVEVKRDSRWFGIIPLLILPGCIAVFNSGPFSRQTNLLLGLLCIYLCLHVAWEFFTGRTFLLPIKFIVTQKKFSKHQCSNCEHQWKGKETALSYGEMQEHLTGTSTDNSVGAAIKDVNTEESPNNNKSEWVCRCGTSNPINLTNCSNCQMFKGNVIPRTEW